jgi:hypothetical protein
LKKDSVKKRIEQLEHRFGGVKVIVGVDRLDYIKGVPQKLYALELFLTQHPEWIGKVVLVQLAVPSRQDVEEYQNLRSTVNELVGRINGRFGTVDFMPIHFMHKSLPFDELCALYAVSDVCLISSTRDGMNLVRVLIQPVKSRLFYFSYSFFKIRIGFVRVYCLSTSTPRRDDPVRICWRGSKLERVNCGEPLGFTAGSRRYTRGGDHGL